MQFAVPTRNHRSSPQLFSSVSRQFNRRRRPIYIFFGLLTFLFLLLKVWGSDGIIRPGDAPKIVVVTVLDRQRYSEEHIAKVMENRREYAEAHGYGVFMPNSTSYKLDGAPSSWSRVPATRHAMSVFKHSEWFWFVDEDAIIMNPTISIEKHVIKPSVLKTLMIKDAPIVPPYSVIHTYKFTPADKINFVLTQDDDGLSTTSYLVRQCPWSRFLLDVWMDPLFRLYGFQKAEKMALDHVVQWHPTLLTKLAVIPQNKINSDSTPNHKDTFKEGELVISLRGCDESGRSCENEFAKYWAMRKRAKR
ncbi:galactosyl transferase GMA12/MNN10 family-domain-containing protein [Peziza echinospora]|nr:galactosyl transferase GMA12/MNN10 family-domain-containing protein [Peziza echinospora]